MKAHDAPMKWKPTTFWKFKDHSKEVFKLLSGEQPDRTFSPYALVELVPFLFQRHVCDPGHSHASTFHFLFKRFWIRDGHAPLFRVLPWNFVQVYGRRDTVCMYYALG